jgi:hypothetical protein
MSCNCSKLSRHSRSASDSPSSLGDVGVLEPADEDGSESISSSSVGLCAGMYAYDDDGSDMSAVRPDLFAQARWATFRYQTENSLSNSASTRVSVQLSTRWSHNSTRPAAMLTQPSAWKAAR